MRDGERVLGVATPALPRDDVVAAFPGCRSDQHPGFSILVPPTLGANSLVVEARTADGRVLEIGTSAMDLSEPFGVVENNGPIAQSAESSVHGWAISALGDLKVSVLAGDVELAGLRVRQGAPGRTSQPRMQRSAPASICRCRFAPCREGAIS